MKQLMFRKYSLCQEFTEQIRAVARTRQRGELELETRARVWWWRGSCVRQVGAVKKFPLLGTSSAHCEAGMGRHRP